MTAGRGAAINRHGDFAAGLVKESAQRDALAPGPRRVSLFYELSGVFRSLFTRGRKTLYGRRRWGRGADGTGAAGRRGGSFTRLHSGSRSVNGAGRARGAGLASSPSPFPALLQTGRGAL